MDTRFYIARHYWKDRENASWQISRQFPPELLEEIKAEYSSLESEQPEYRQYNGGTVFFVYEEAEDIYGRKITEITATTCRKCLQNPGNITTSVLERLYSHDQKRLNFDLELDFDPHKNDSIRLTADTNKSPAITSSALFKIAAFAIVVLVLISGWFSDWRREHKLVETSQIEGRKIQKRAQTSSDAQVVDQSAKIKPPTSKSSRESTRERFCDEYRGLKSVPPYIDSKCVQHYINEQCDECQERLRYEDWLKKAILENRFIDHCKDVNAKEDKINVINYLCRKDGLNRKLSKDFFDGKK